ncbi:MAG: SGNH/GDSL hydrolase family protein [Deltaproteobacteria bacterium]|nr:SGNH/GDSL hydrolase family protein [Deltaproteobacteria bacterium]
MGRFVAVSISVALGVVAAECMLRWRAVPPVNSPPPAVTEAGDVPSIEGVLALALPNQRVTYRGAPYATNSRGFRGPEFTLDKSADTFRIAMLGDSYTMGSGVRYEEAYPARVEAALAAEHFGKRVEVLNFGLSGLNLEGSIRLRLPMARDYRPDLLVYGFTVNDVEGPHYWPDSAAPRAPGRWRLLDLLRERWNYVREILRPAESWYVRELDDNFFNNPPAWKDFTAELDELAVAARELGACVVVFLHPQVTILTPQHPYLRHYQAAADAARERGMFVVDGFPAFVGKSEDDLRCSRYDWHPNAKGHALLGETLAEGLRALPARCLPPRPAS